MRRVRVVGLAALLVAACAPRPAVSTDGPPLIVVASPAPAAPLAVAPALVSASNLSDDELVERYHALWRAALAQKNGGSPADVDHELTVTKERIKRVPGRPSDPSTALVVEYVFTIDWAKVNVVDVVPIRIAADNPALTIFPVAARPSAADGWLAISDATTLATASPVMSALLGTRLARVPFASHLKYPSLDAAKAALPGTARARFIEPSVRLELARADDPKEAAGLYLRGTGNIPGTKQCLYADLNLVTGQAERTEGYCGPVN